MRIEPCRDAVDLRARFGARLRAALVARRTPLEPVTVVAPTQRLRQWLEVVAARDVGSLAAVSFVHYSVLARRVLELGGERSPARLPAGIQEVVAALAARESGGVLARLERDHDSTARLLAATLRRLREADLVERLRASEPGLPLVAVATRHGELVRALASKGLADDAVLFAHAARTAEGVAGRLGTVLHVGAYDVTAIVARLLETLGRATELEHLVLGCGAGPAFAWARARAVVLGALPAGVSPAAEGLLGGRVDRLFSGSESHAARPLAAVRFIEAPGPEAEVTAAARIVLGWAAKGLPLEGIALLARDLESYRPWLDAVLPALSISFTSSLPARPDRHPWVIAFEDLLACAAGDGAIERWARLSCSPCFDGGARDEAAARIVALVGDPGVRVGWAESVELATELARRLLVDSYAAAGALESVAELAVLEGVADPVPFVEFVRHVRRVLAGAGRGSADRGGVRVLDLMQARGLAFRAVVVLGVHVGTLPRPSRSDPFLPESMLRAAGGAFLRAAGDDEERLLFALAVASATDELAITWQRVDDRNRARGPSAYLGELMRVAAPLAVVRSLPTHPARALAVAAADGEALTPTEVVIGESLLRLDAGRAALSAATDVGSDPEGLRPGVELLRLLERERIERGDELKGLAHDGLVGGIEECQSLRVSALVRLHDCPLRHFFADVLAIAELEDPRARPLVDGRLLGTAIHAALEQLYDAADGRVAAADRRERMIAAIPGVMRAALTPVTHSLADSYPAVGRALVSGWSDVVARFVETDLADLDARGTARIATEERFELRLPELGGSVVAGRFDRVVTFADGSEQVGDYKTGRAKEGGRLPGTKLPGLQLALYGMVRRRQAGRAPEIAVLGMRPREEPRRLVATGNALEAALPRLGEVLATLLELRRAGAFPLTSDAGRRICKSCPYRLACRVDDDAAVRRGRGAAPFASYHRLGGAGS